jgi:hypothetical protein
MELAFLEKASKYETYGAELITVKVRFEFTKKQTIPN